MMSSSSSSSSMTSMTSMTSISISISVSMCIRLIIIYMPINFDLGLWALDDQLLFRSLGIYLHVYMSTCVCIYIYIYTHTCMCINVPTNITPTNIARLKLSGKSPMGLGIPPLKIQIMFESNPPKLTMLAGRLGVD